MKNISIFLLIIFIATFLRLVALDKNPPSLYWDEVSLGYNAFSILTTGHDEHGEFFPIARFTAFGDYKPPGYIYATVPAMALFGVNEFSVRFPSALAGIAMVVTTYYLVKELLHKESFALLAAFLLAISPWSLQLSRAAFEAHLAAAFSLLAITTFLYGLRRAWLLPVSMIFFVLSFYTFNANRILAPLFICLLGIIYFKELMKRYKWVIISAIIALLMLLPSVSYLQSRESRLRLQEVSIFTNLEIIKKANDRIERSGNTLVAKIIHNRRRYFAQEFLKHYTDHFKGQFLFITGDVNPRLSTQDIGHVYLVEGVFIIVGILWLLMKKNRLTALIFGWVLLSPIPAAMARETPHMLRIASILPTYQILAVIGLMGVWAFLRPKQDLLRWGFVILIVMFYAGQFIYYQHNYWIHYSRDWSSDWQYGYKQMVEKVGKYENDYDHIVISDFMGRPYIYFLFYNKVNPLVYVSTRQAERDWFGLWNVFGFGKYQFVSEGIPQLSGKVLYVGSKGSFGESSSKLDEVRDLKGNIVFEIGER